MERITHWARTELLAASAVTFDDIEVVEWRLHNEKYARRMQRQWPLFDLEDLEW